MFILFRTLGWVSRLSLPTGDLTYNGSGVLGELINVATEDPRQRFGQSKHHTRWNVDQWVSNISDILFYARAARAHAHVGSE